MPYKESDNRAPRDATMRAIAEEVEIARLKFPTGKHLLAALGEEFGEVCRALLEFHYEGGPRENVIAEAVQVAAMAIRIIEEGVMEYPGNEAQCGNEL